MTIDEARSELGSLEAVNDCILEHGLKPTCLELLLAWPRPGKGYLEELEVMQAAIEIFDPELILAACMDPEIESLEEATDHLRHQCRALAPRRVALEFLPWSGIGTVAAARALVNSVAADNLGYLIDTWHFARAGMDYTTLAQLPGDKIFCIQLGDAAADADTDIFRETLGHRLPPGEGCVDWNRFLSLLSDKGVDCPMGTEMFSDAVKSMPLKQAAEHLYATQQQAFKI